MMRLILPIVFLATFVPAYAAEPCTKAAPDCTGWVNLGNQARALVYRTYALETKNDTITRALIMIHGANRDADNYFRTALAVLTGLLRNIDPAFKGSKFGEPGDLEKL